jgi:hypothetical protein
MTTSGFAAWASENAESLKNLGAGHHFENGGDEASNVDTESRIVASACLMSSGGVSTVTNLR